ncbi:tetratricopeptide repeat protein [Bacterioplanes sanyensis]|nr:tetratricopeptide repeat protein [Bacterioplanes sanyensis]
MKQRFFSPLTWSSTSRGLGVAIIGLAVIALSNRAFADAQTQPDPLQHGIQLRQQGQLQQSIDVLSKALQQNPQQLRLKLELAVSYLQLGEFDQAQQWAASVLHAEQVPDQVRANIERFLAGVERQRQGYSQAHWLQRAQLFAGHDDNATIGPDDAELDIGQLSGESIKNADDFAGLQYDLTYLSNRIPSASRYYAGFSLYDKRYQDISDSNLSFANLRAGGQWPLTSSIQGHASIGLSHIYLGNDALANYSYLTLSGRWQASTDHRVSLRLEANPRRYLSDTDDDRQGTRYSQMAGYQYQLGKAELAIAANLRQARLSGDSERYGEQEWSLQWTQPWTMFEQQWHWRWRSAISQRDYQHTDTRYGLKRQDDGIAHQLELQWQWRQGWQLALSHQYHDRDSNQDIYQYQRQLTQLSLQYRSQ